MKSDANATGDIQQAGGFVHFPDGTFSADPRAVMSQDQVTHLWRTTATPQLVGVGDVLRGRITYSRQSHRWLPVSWNQVSADGLAYAYAEAVYPQAAVQPLGPGPFATGVRIHVVDVRSAADRVVFKSNVWPFYYRVVSFAGLLIYLSPVCAEGCGSDALKLWRLDIGTGGLTKVSERGGFDWLIGDQVAWVATYEDTNKPNQLVRLDLATGQEAVWLTGARLQLIGLGSDGAPLLETIESGNFALVRVTSPDQTEKVYSGYFYIAVPDGASTWLGSGGSGNEGIYLLTARTAVQRVSDFGGLPLGPHN
jgi:hypothetical protein